MNQRWRFFHQYCWTCLQTNCSENIPVLALWFMASRIRCLAYWIRDWWVFGLVVWMLVQSAQYHRLRYTPSSISKKYRITYPCPQIRLLLHFGQHLGRSQRYSFPRSCNFFKSTAQYTTIFLCWGARSLWSVIALLFLFFDSWNDIVLLIFCLTERDNNFSY